MLLAVGCATLLYSRVYTTFERVRVVVPPPAMQPSQVGVAVPLPDLSELSSEPAAVILRLRNEGSARRNLTVGINGVALGRVSLDAGEQRRADFSVRGALLTQRGALALAGDGPGWSLRYLEIANVHGHSDGLLTFVIVPSTRVAYPSVSPVVAILVLLLLVAIPPTWLRTPGGRIERCARWTLGTVGLTLLLATLASSIVSPYKVLLSGGSFLLCGSTLYYPVLRRGAIALYGLTGTVRTAVLRIEPLLERALGSNARVTLLIVVIFGSLYAWTLYPGVGGRINFDDSAKWQTLWMTHGTPHSTGYPLYLALSELFGHVLAWWQPFTRITTISAVFGVAALCAAYRCWERITGRKLASLAAVGLLGTSLTFWMLSTEAEVYTLNAFFVAAVLYCFIRFHDTRNRRYFYWGTFIYAISFGNHLTMITMLPGLVYLTWVTDRRIFVRPKDLLLVLAFVAIGASQYGYSSIARTIQVRSPWRASARTRVSGNWSTTQLAVASGPTWAPGRSGTASSSS